MQKFKQKRFNFSNKIELIQNKILLLFFEFPNLLCVYVYTRNQYLCLRTSY